MTDPTPIPFPTDRHSLLRCVRSYLDLLTLRVDGGIEDEAGCDYPLPGGLSLDAVTCSLMAYAAEDDANSAAFGLEPYSEHDDVEEIVASVRRLLDRAGPPGAN
ncbi:MAG: hypothetical protein KDC98_08160 [Planctomycetes bacterium]|nr:hypothetical protein [Planctomycetota bacterium]